MQREKDKQRSVKPLNPTRLVGAMALIAILARWGVADTVTMGSSSGRAWEQGGGTIPAMVIRTSTTVERTNAPGGVVDFEGRPGWIYPKRADPLVNLAVGADVPARGGSIKSPNNPAVRSQLGNLIDDDGRTALDVRSSVGIQGPSVLGMIVDIDLGAPFGVDRLKFFPRNADAGYPAPDFPHQSDFMRGFEIFVNDGSPETQRDGVPNRETVVIESQNDEAVVDERIQPQYVRHVRLKSLTLQGFEIAEFQVFGTGFVPAARYVSSIFDFEDPALFGNLRWLEEVIGDPGFSGARIRTRAGDDPQPVEFTKIRPGERVAGVSRDEVPWKRAQDVDDAELRELIANELDNPEVRTRDAIAQFEALPLDRQALITLDSTAYVRLSTDEKGGIRDDLRNWSGWSAAYTAGDVADAGELGNTRVGAPIDADTPRRYFQFSIDFASREFEAVTGLGGLAFDVITPSFAEDLVAEIAPRRAGLGEDRRFTYALLARSRAGRARGFDSIAIETPIRVGAIGRVSIERAGAAVETADFSAVDLDSGPIPWHQGDFAIAAVADDGFVLTLPPIADSEALLSVEFDCAVLRFGTTFSGRVQDSTSGAGLWQPVVAGNAADLAEGDLDDSSVRPVGSSVPGNLSVAVPLTREQLIDVRAQPPVMTPNADGANDRALLRYDITNVTSPSPVEVRILDLSGLVVRHLYEGEDMSGRYSRGWDAEDDGGSLVPPGNYLFTVRLRTQAGSQTKTGLISVVY